MVIESINNEINAKKSLKKNFRKLKKNPIEINKEKNTRTFIYNSKSNNYNNNNKNNENIINYTPKKEKNFDNFDLSMENYFSEHQINDALNSFSKISQKNFEKLLDNKENTIIKKENQISDFIHTKNFFLNDNLEKTKGFTSFFEKNEEYSTNYKYKKDKEKIFENSAKKAMPITYSNFEFEHILKNKDQNFINNKSQKY